MNCIKIDKDRCKGCQLCTYACPVKIIVMSKDLNKKGVHYAKQIDPERCTACTFCAITCPDACIEVFKDE